MNLLIFGCARLQKQGYEGDGPFYYWLSYASYFTGREQYLAHFGKRSLPSILEKEGLEPWSDEHPTANGFEEHVPSILKKLESDTCRGKNVWTLSYFYFR